MARIADYRIVSAENAAPNARQSAAFLRRSYRLLDDGAKRENIYPNHKGIVSLPLPIPVK